MRPASVPKPRAAGPISILALASAVAVLLGIAVAVLPPWLITAGLVMPLFVALLIAWPELALIAFIGLTCGLIHPAFVPQLAVLGGRLGAADLALGLLLSFGFMSLMLPSRGREATNHVPVPSRFMWWTYGLFLTLWLLSTALSLGPKGIKPKFALGEARDLGYLLFVPVVLIVLRSPQRLRRFLIGLVVLGLLFSVGQILQGVFDLPVFGTAGRLEVLETLGRFEYGATRTLTRGINVIILALLLVIGGYVTDRLPATKFFPIAALLAAGVFLTFGRTTYAVVIIGTVFLVTWLDARKLPQLAVVALLAAVVGVAVLAAWKPAVISGFWFRITSAREEIASGASAQWRYDEARQMVPHILQNPLTGIGLGAEYKGLASTPLNEDLNRYIHNAYLYMAGKMGLPALLVFLTMLFSIYRLGRRVAVNGRADTLMRIAAGASAVMVVRFVLASFTEPHFMEDNSVVVIALSFALVELTARAQLVSRQSTGLVPSHGALGVGAPRRAT